ncbi:hypothetical protein [Azotobacter vinelandii]|uniref:hypothetical protein n=1 Tax=Azotobacter vinelandii TaxID=354 RepID=UPI00091C4DA1|nr:hypothetical protein [Azotobacter vinelandii]WKN23098.1 hypothetical protein AVAEIV_001124 [Azotobacter vinelandii]SFY34194.1 hypothetical protein SAMN04244547_05195 [Azotobacter vinelandii]
MTERSSDADAWNQDSNPRGSTLWARVPNTPVTKVILLLIAGIAVFIFGEWLKALVTVVSVLAAIFVLGWFFPDSDEPSQDRTLGYYFGYGLGRFCAPKKKEP